MQQNYSYMSQTQQLSINTSHQTEKLRVIQVFQTQPIEQSQDSFHKLSDQFVQTRLNQDLQKQPQAEEQLLQSESSQFIDKSFSSTEMSSLQYIDENESPTKQVSYPCYHCKQKINGIFYELPCLHIFHKLCLYEGVILSQMNSSHVELKCICTETIPLVSLRVLYSKYNADNLLSQIYQNQIKAIIENIKNTFTLLKCQNCEFVVIHNPKLPEGNYCPLCLMNTKNKKLN